MARIPSSCHHSLHRYDPGGQWITSVPAGQYHLGVAPTGQGNGPQLQDVRLESHTGSVADSVQTASAYMQIISL